MKNKFIISTIVLSLVAISCEWEQMEPDIAISDTVKISFKKDIMPMFDESCGGSSCHGANAIAPILTAEEAYINLTSTNLVDTLNPEGSELYRRMISTSNPMPPKGVLAKSKTSAILQWIKQGAQDN